MNLSPPYLEKVDIQLFREVKKRLSRSETMSLYSVPSCDFGFFLGGMKGISARESIGLLFVLAQTNPVYAALAKERINAEAYKHSYEGLWKQVHKLSRIGFKDLMLYHFLDSVGSLDDLFGNYLKLGIKRIQKMKLLPIRPKKVQIPQRRRGYNDHGSRRDDSHWLPTEVWIGPNPVKRDYQDPPPTKERILHFLFG